MTTSAPDPASVFKKQAAEHAVTLVRDGMVVGLGTGSTAAFVVAALGRRIRDENLHISAIPTSDVTEQQALSEGIPLTTFGQHTVLDIAIDGADEIETSTLNLVKGRGGALLREKIVASAAKQLVIVADTSKYMDHLGESCPLPVEIVPFGWELTISHLARLGAQVSVRKNRDGSFYVTDEKNLIADCVFGPITDPDALSRNIYAIVGVIEHGLFLHMAERAIIAGPEGLSVATPGTSVPQHLACSLPPATGKESALSVPKQLLVIMGVSGSGKTTIALGLQNELGWPYQEGDHLHPSHNVEKMATGTPLTDEDRWPWLERCREWMENCATRHSGAILTCSALKRIYRDQLRASGLNPVFVYLYSTQDALSQRMEKRKGHYMPATLLPSQLQTLEPPQQDELSIAIDAAASPSQIIATVIHKLRTL